MKKIEKSQIKNIIIILPRIDGRFKMITLSNKDAIESYLNGEFVVNVSDFDFEGLVGSGEEKIKLVRFGEGDACNLVAVPWTKCSYFSFSTIKCLDKSDTQIIKEQWSPASYDSEIFLENQYELIQGSPFRMERFSATVEFYLLDEKLNPVISKIEGCAGLANQFRETVVECLKSMEVDISSYGLGKGKGQQYITLAGLDNPLDLAMDICLLRIISVHFASKMNIVVSFAPKIFTEEPGSNLIYNFYFKKDKGSKNFFRSIKDNMGQIVSITNPLASSTRKLIDLEQQDIVGLKKLINSSSDDNYDILSFHFADSMANPYLSLGFMFYYGSNEVDSSSKDWIDMHKEGCIGGVVKLLGDQGTGSYLGILRSGQAKFFNDFISEEERISLVARF